MNEKNEEIKNNNKGKNYQNSDKETLDTTLDSSSDKVQDI